MGEVSDRSSPIPQEPNLENVVYVDAPEVSPEEEEENSVLSRDASFISVINDNDFGVERDHLGESHAVSTSLIDKLKVECKKISTALKSFFANLQENRNEFFYRNTKADQESKHFKSLKDVFVKMDQEFLDKVNVPTLEDITKQLDDAETASSDRRDVIKNLTSAKLGLERIEKSGGKNDSNFDAVKARFQKIANKAVPYTLLDDHYKLAQSIYHAHGRTEMSAILGLDKIDPNEKKEAKKEAAARVVRVLDEMEARVLANPTLADNLKYRMKYLAQIQGIKLNLAAYAPEICKMVNLAREDRGKLFERRYIGLSMTSYLVSSYEWAKAHQTEKQYASICDKIFKGIPLGVRAMREKKALSEPLLAGLLEGLLRDLPLSEEPPLPPLPEEADHKSEVEEAEVPVQPPPPPVQPPPPLSAAPVAAQSPPSRRVEPQRPLQSSSFEVSRKSAEEVKIRAAEQQQARSQALGLLREHFKKEIKQEKQIAKFADLTEEDIKSLFKDLERRLSSAFRSDEEINKVEQIISALEKIQKEDVSSECFSAIQRCQKNISEVIHYLSRAIEPDEEEDELEVR